MTTTTNTTSSTTSTSSDASLATAASSATSLGKDDFLKLLMAQLANQDPTQPMDDTAFVAQLAQFSQVEQLQNANTNLETLITAQASSNETSTAALVGTSVTYQTSAVSLTAGTNSVISGQLPSNAASVVALISDSSGNSVRTLNLGAQTAGPLNVTWDGKGDLGQSEPSGTYSVSFKATDASGNAVAVSTQGSGQVTGVSFAKGYPVLVVSGQQVALNNVIEVDAP